MHCHDATKVIFLEFQYFPVKKNNITKSNLVNHRPEVDFYRIFLLFPQSRIGWMFFECYMTHMKQSL